MSQAALTDLKALEGRLRRVAWGLLARQVARALPHTLLGASALAVCALVLLVLLPWTLFGGAVMAAPLVLLMSAPGGGLAGAVIALRNAHRPGIRDAALALEARLGSSSASLATAMEASGQFAAPVLGAAAAELDAALAARGPVLYSNRALLTAPVAVLCAALLAALAWSAPTDPGEARTPGHQGARSGGLTAINVESSRDSNDSRAMAEAVGMRKAAASLQTAAAILRQADATTEQTQTALSNARREVESLRSGVRPEIDIPLAVPELKEKKAELAGALETAAGGLGQAAESTDTAAQGNGSGDTKAPQTAGPRTFVPFPAVSESASAPGAASEVAGQSAARRALVARALEAARQE